MTIINVIVVTSALFTRAITNLVNACSIYAVVVVVVVVVVTVVVVVWAGSEGVLACHSPAPLFHQTI